MDAGLGILWVQETFHALFLVSLKSLRAKEFFQTIPEGTQASRASPLVNSAFGRHRSIQGWLWLIVKETNIQTAMTEVPQGGYSREFFVGVCRPVHTFVVSSKTIPDSRPIWAKSIPFSDRNGTKTIPFGAAHTCMAYIRECPPPPPTPFGRSSGCGILVKKGTGMWIRNPLSRQAQIWSKQERMKDSPLSGLNKYVNIFKAIPDVGQKNICTLHKVAEK